MIVPVVAWALWLLPNDGPAATAGAETAALADATPLVDDRTGSESSAREVRSEPNPSVLVVPVEPTLAETSTTLPQSTTTASTSVQIDVTASTDALPTTSAGPPEALASVEPTATEPLSLGEQALARVVFPWRQSFPDWRVEFRGARSGIRALTYPQEKRVEIFVRESDTAATLHRVFAHELGHIVDVEWNSDDDRRRWEEQRGLSSDAPWWPSAESPDFATGAGDFAEAFAVWETGVTTRSTVGDQPSFEDLALLRELSAG